MDTIYLVKKDLNNAIRLVHLRLDNNGSYFTIVRKTGLLSGTITRQPDIDINKGKASRTLAEQAELEFASILSDYLDKGYKYLSAYGVTHPDYITNGAIETIISETVTDSRGFAKHMLAKQPYPFQQDGSSFITLGKTDRRFKQTYYGSYKIDGVRCTLHYDYAANKIKTSSRGGKEFDASTKHITENPVLLSVLRENPDITLDGELYIHGKPLPYLSGLSRLKYYDPKVHDKLQFYVFDVMDKNKFLVRYDLIKKFFDKLILKASILGDLGILDYVRCVDHEPVFGYDDIMEMHDRAISDGYEGLILRDPNYEYGYGARDWRMIKIKIFQDAEFQIVGKKDGLRKEDMVFVLNLPGGNTFEAKPVGSRDLREYYSDNIAAYIGRLANVKFFGYTPYGVPNLPTLRYIRD